MFFMSVSGDDASACCVREMAEQCASGKQKKREQTVGRSRKKQGGIPLGSHNAIRGGGGGI